jgi:hypothetical protein
VSALYWVLAGLAAARCFRVFAVDGIGEPLRTGFDNAMLRFSKRTPKLAESVHEGAYCVYCFPFWITLFWVGTGLAWHDTWPWQLAAGALGVSYVVSHALAILDAENVDKDEDVTEVLDET